MSAAITYQFSPWGRKNSSSSRHWFSDFFVLFLHRNIIEIIANLLSSREVFAF